MTGCGAREIQDEIPVAPHAHVTFSGHLPIIFMTQPAQKVLEFEGNH